MELRRQNTKKKDSCTFFEDLGANLGHFEGYLGALKRLGKATGTVVRMICPMQECRDHSIFAQPKHQGGAVSSVSRLGVRPGVGAIHLPPIFGPE